jgi:hypothetical protein
MVQSPLARRSGLIREPDLASPLATIEEQIVSAVLNEVCQYFDFDEHAEV